ncbi:MAG: hypothetical protein P9M15_04765 [Candidatus Electryoneaceae bacterium]|nr:hypothetical protein [Candidatus Electryoneaceae bacterium]
MFRSEKTYWIDILDSARLIIRFVEGMDFDDFYDDIKTQSAVLHKILILGEAA